MKKNKKGKLSLKKEIVGYLNVINLNKVRGGNGVAAEEQSTPLSSITRAEAVADADGTGLVSITK